jgi:hypothetical protein
MYRLFVLFLFFNTLLLPSEAQEGLKKTKINSDLRMKIHEELIPMDFGQRIVKYVSDREPVAMFTTTDSQVDLGINRNSSQWGQEDIDLLRQFYRSGILNLYDQVEFIQDTVRNINDREYIVFEFIGKLEGREDSFRGKRVLSKYIYIQYTIKEDYVMLFNFSAPAIARQKWGNIAYDMMNSIKLK